MKQVKMIFKPDGSVVVDAQGFVGEECMGATKPYEQALGIKRKEKAKPELYVKGKTEVRRDNWA